jgi:RNA polymerase sigma factor (sigma-70 family)
MDGQLLEDFLRRQDQAAFAALVHRHGAMVLAVCNRILGNVTDAEDAFQATFLVLVRKARSLTAHTELGGWLHGVARRTALKAKGAAARRRVIEQAVPRYRASGDPVRNDWLPLLDEALGRLPEKYRLPIILCDLEGRTRKEVAHQLRVPEGTVAGRLARGRVLLRKRLIQQGLIVTGGSLVGMMSRQVGAACMPAGLMSSMTQAAALVAAGQEAAASGISASVASITEGMLNLMLLTKLKIATTVLLGVAVAGAGMMALAPAQAPGPVAPRNEAQPKQKAPNTGSPDAGMIRRLITQFASPTFAEREAATKELRRIGEPALAPLREAAQGNSALEVRRRAEEVARGIVNDAIDRLLKQESQEEEIHNKKISQILQRVTELARERLQADGSTPRGQKDPFLSDAYLRLARAQKSLGETNAAAEAYQQAEAYCNDAQKIRAMQQEMFATLLPLWEQTVREQIAQDPAWKALAAKYPLVLLHSRRFVPGGRYLQSTYSFLYETADERKHYGDVQLQFDNGRGDRTFQVNMVTNQKNTVVDLGNVDFTIDPNPAKADFEGPDRQQHEAIQGHVYLQKVADTNGNRFFVLFKMLAVDEQSRYIAFIWRRLPGGTIVRRN